MMEEPKSFKIGLAETLGRMLEALHRNLNNKILTGNLGKTEDGEEIGSISREWVRLAELTFNTLEDEHKGYLDV